MKECVWILVTVFNREENLNGFFERISKQDYPNYRLILIDHGSRPINRTIPEWVKVVKSSPAKWWTGAMNDGIRYVLSSSDTRPGDFILFLNDDVGFDDSLVSKLVKSSVGYGRAIVGAITLDAHSKLIMDADNHLSILKARHICPLRGKTLEQAGTAALPSDILKGRGVIYPLEVFDSLGLLYEKLARRSDPEMAYRAKRAGYSVLIDPAIVVTSQLDSRTLLSGKALKLSDGISFLFSPRSYSNVKDTAYYFFKCLDPIRAVYCTIVCTFFSISYFMYKWFRSKLI